MPMTLPPARRPPPPPVATASFSVIGTVVGAYFGLKIGADGTSNAIKGIRDEAAKAQAFAAESPGGSHAGP